MVSRRLASSYDRALERRRAVALARHFREAEGLSIAQIADRLGRSPATVKAYFYDPTGEKARAVKARYAGVCRGCGADTQPRNGKGDAYAGAGAGGDGGVARSVREASLVLRLVTDARTPAWGRPTRAPYARGLAGGERHH